MNLRKSLIYSLLSIFIVFGQAFAWGPDGHHTVGAIADKMIAGTHADTEVKAILGNLTLRDVAVWADCAKGIDPRQGYTYQTAGKYKECKIFENPEEEARMRAFVLRNEESCDHESCQLNDKNCDYKACHTEYHYADIAVQHNSYSRSYKGTRDDDIVNAVVAAMHVLKGEPATAPFKFEGKREALMLLAHYVGDIHQPLHIGAIYLDKKGRSVDPDKGTYEGKIDTKGGNDILICMDNLHSIWDNIPVTLKEERIKTLLPQAMAVPVTKGQIYDWPLAWANGSIAQAKKAFTGVKFYPRLEDHWYTTLPSDYYYKMEMIKQPQLVNAGAHLAQVLQAIWP